MPVIKTILLYVKVKFKQTPKIATIERMQTNNAETKLILLTKSVPFATYESFDEILILYPSLAALSVKSPKSIFPLLLRSAL